MSSISFARPEVDDLHHGLQILSHALREPWRLELQQSSKTLGRLPANLLASKESVFAARDRASAFETALGRPISRWLEEAADMLELTYGARSKWRQDDPYTRVYPSWRAMVETVDGGVANVFNLDPSGDMPTGMDWETSCRACSELDFDMRAADRLMQAVRQGSLPQGVRVTREISRTGSALGVHILDHRGDLLAAGDHEDAAVAAAIRVHCSTRPAHEVTPEQFLAITTQVSVDVGRGKSGLAKTGPERLLYRDREAQQALRTAMNRAYDRGLVTGAVPAPADRGPVQATAHRMQWIDTACQEVMSCAFDTNAKSNFIPGAGHILMVKGPQLSDGMVRSIHQHLVNEAREEAEVRSQVNNARSRLAMQ